MSEGVYLAYLLAHQRQGPYLFGVASDLDVIEARVDDGRLQCMPRNGRPARFPPLPVWLETHASERCARQRITEIRGWPLS